MTVPATRPSSLLADLSQEALAGVSSRRAGTLLVISSQACMHDGEQQRLIFSARGARGGLSLTPAALPSRGVHGMFCGHDRIRRQLRVRA